MYNISSVFNPKRPALASKPDTHKRMMNKNLTFIEPGDAESQCLSQYPVRQRNHLARVQQDWLAEEVPVALVYNGISHVVMMATPKDLAAFAIGFSLSEGIIASADDIYDIQQQPACNGIQMHVELSSRRFMQLKQKRRSLAGPTGCGICGVEQLQEVTRPIPPLPFTQHIDLKVPDRGLAQLKALQTVGQLTGCSPMAHSAAAVRTSAATWRSTSCWAIAASKTGSKARYWFQAAPAMKWFKKPPRAASRSCSQCPPPPALRWRWPNAAT